MNLWLSRYDARVRALGTQKELLYGLDRTPFGEGLVLMSDNHVLALYLAENKEEALTMLRKKWPTALLRASTVANEVIASLFGKPNPLSTVSLIAIGTPFQLTVWEYLCRIPEGRTLTYGEVAKAIGRPNAARAVGQAVGSNEISLLIPCHRVVSMGKSGGKIGGYRWGVERKKSLLAWELLRKDPLVMPF